LGAVVEFEVEYNEWTNIRMIKNGIIFSLRDFSWLKRGSEFLVGWASSVVFGMDICAEGTFGWQARGFDK